MIGSLRGQVLLQTSEHCILEVGGVGYQVTLSWAVLSHAPVPGNELFVYVYTDVRENAIALYGFAELFEREVFLLLKKVNGIGSRLAMNVISTIGAESLLAAIGASDVTALQRVSGIGKKTAERIVVELREHVRQLIELPEDVRVIPSGARKSPGSPTDVSFPVRSAGPREDALLALEKLGIPPERARHAIDQASTAIGEAGRLSAEELLRGALKQL